MVWKKKPVKRKNPYAADVTNHTHGQTSEKRVVKIIGAVQVIASGAIEGLKSDGILEHFRIECKATIHQSISVKREWLMKIRKEALETNRCPVLTISFVDRQGQADQYGSEWAMIPLHQFADFAQWKKENGDEI